MAVSAWGSSAVTNFSGNWVGLGVITQKSPWTGKKTEPCRSVEIKITQTEALLRIERYRGHCGLLDSDWGPIELEIRDSKLWNPEEPTEQVGSIEGNILRTLFSGGAAYAFNLRLNPSAAGSQQPTLDSYYGVQNVFGTIVIEGQLLPKTTE